MPTYTFTFKKDDIYVEFTTDDKSAIENQFQIWVTCASVYSYKKNNKTAAPNEAVRDFAPTRKENVENKTLEKPNPAPQPDRVEESNFEQKEKPSAQYQEAQTINSLQNIDKPVEFENILENSIDNPTFQPNSKKDERFIKLLNTKNAKTLLEKFITCAYYLCEYEQHERFSLKMINTKLMQNISQVIDHSILQEAIEKGYVEPFPDLTGVAGITEYRLSESGEGLFLNGYEE